MSFRLTVDVHQTLIVCLAEAFGEESHKEVLVHTSGTVRPAYKSLVVGLLGIGERVIPVGSVILVTLKFGSGWST